MYLMLLLALFISALSPPRDLKERTLHTVVTKPVRKARSCSAALSASPRSAPDC